MTYNYEARKALRALGLDPDKHLPESGANPILHDVKVRTEDGGWYYLSTKIWVDPKPPYPQYPTNPDSRRIVRSHRVKAKCPHCAQVVSFARIFQHLKTHTKD